MQKRPLGNTGINVSEVGFGTWQLGNEKDWGTMDDAEGVRLVHAAIDHGCNFFDTAPNYGLGQSETILGKAVKGKREQVILSSKCGHHSNDEQNFEPDQLISSIEGSLRRLGTDYLDSVLLHNPPFATLTDDSPQFDALKQLKAAGKIRAYGASVDTGKEVDAILNQTSSQVIEVMFNIFHQEPKQAIERAGKAGVGIITKVPLDSGWLTGKYSQDSQFTGIRSRWTKAVIERRSQLVEKVRAIIGPDQAMVKVALQYILATAGVSSVIPGARTIDQLEANLKASQTVLPGQIKADLDQLFVAELKHDPLPW